MDIGTGVDTCKETTGVGADSSADSTNVFEKDDDDNDMVGRQLCKMYNKYLFLDFFLTISNTLSRQD